MELPRALAPWAAQLDLIPREVISEFGPLVQRLDMAVGPLKVHVAAGAGEPEGFEGIARRGSYDRLLLSEWLLTEEFPEEFDRRAAMAEHAFLQVAHQEPAGARVSVALFDSGPGQIGAPRIAQIAALMVLARRAEAAGARFEWGIFQQPCSQIHQGLSPAALRALIEARCACDAKDEDIARWRERFGCATDKDDVWIIGSPRLTRLPSVQGASILTIAEPFLSDSRVLEVTTVRSGRAVAETTLELPSEPVCIRLLRELARPLPPPSIRAGVQRSAPSSNLLFLPGGTKLVGRLNQNTLVSYAIPNSPWAGAGKPKPVSAPSGNPILSAARMLKRYALVTTTSEPDVLQIEWAGKPLTRVSSGPFRLPADVSVPPITDHSPLGAAFPLFDSSTYECSGWVVQIGDVLVFAAPDGKPTIPVAAVECTHLRAVAETREGVVWVGKTGNDWHLAARNSAGARVTGHLFPEALEAYFGYGRYFMDRLFGLAAVEIRACNWEIFWERRTDTENLSEAGMESQGAIVGIHGASNAASAPVWLVSMAEDRRTIHHQQGDTSVVLATASSDIITLAVSPYAQSGADLPDLAYITDRGELTVYSLAHRRALFTMQFDRPTPRPATMPDASQATLREQSGA